jgi:anti-sigma factor ChrR (cupin superfamily)
MLIHADFQHTIIITPQDYQWTPSPGGQVNRVMFERIGQEQARATSLVEYPKGSDFPAHQHPLGEEILVLRGIFTEDQTHHYAQGYYLTRIMDKKFS